MAAEPLRAALLIQLIIVQTGLSAADSGISAKPVTRTFRGTVPANRLLDAISRGDSIEVRQASVQGDLDFTAISLPLISIQGKTYRAVRSRISCDEDVTIKGNFRMGDQPPVVFLAPVSFVSTKFLQGVNWSHARFEDALVFDSSSFYSDVDLRWIEVRGDMRLFSARFNNDQKGSGPAFQADESDIHGSFNAENLVCKAPFRMRGIHIAGTASFRRAQFDKELDLGGLGSRQSDFGGAVDFTRSFLPILAMPDAAMRDAISFAGAQVGSDNCVVAFEGASAAKDWSFDDATLRGALDLEDTQVGGTLSFRRVNLRAFQYAKLSTYTQFGGLRLDWANWASSAWFWLPAVDPRRTLLDVPEKRAGLCASSEPRGRLMVMNEEYRANDSAAIQQFLKIAETNLRQAGEDASANEVFYRRRLLERERKPGYQRVWECVVADWIFGYTVRAARPFWLLFAVWIVLSIWFRKTKVATAAAVQRGLIQKTCPVKSDATAITRNLSWRDAAYSGFVWLSRFDSGNQYTVNTDGARRLLWVAWYITWPLTAALAISIASNFPDVGR